MAKNESKFRKKKLGFTALPNHVLFDTKLDEDSVFLYAMIQYHITIPEFDLYKSYLVKLCKERNIGQRKFERMWKNLKDVGYLKQYKMNGKGGEWFYEYELLDYPETVDIVEESPDMQNVHVVKNSDDHTLHNADVQNGDVVIGDVENVGTINKTILNNNISNNIIKTTTTSTSDIDYAIQSYVDNYGCKPNPAQIRDMEKWIIDIGIYDVESAICNAAIKGKEYDYARGIMRKVWMEANKNKAHTD